MAVKLNSKSMFVFRLAVSCIVTITGVAYPFFEDRKFSSRMSSIETAHWNPKQPGYAFHVISSVGEWIACLSLGIYVASYYKEFQTFSLEVSHVENAELERPLNGEYSRVKQSKEDEVSDE